jgi:flagellar protein FliS
MNMSQELTAYRQTEVESASPVELVILLCDTLVKDLKQVIASIRAGNIEERVRHSNHAFDVLKELDLMLDFENGGNTAKELAGVYSYVRAKLMESQFKLDPAVLERQIEFMTQIRDAWKMAIVTAKPAEVSKPMAEMDGFSGEPFSPYVNMVESAQSYNWSA